MTAENLAVLSPTNAITDDLVYIQFYLEAPRVPLQPGITAPLSMSQETNSAGSHGTTHLDARETKQSVKES